MFWEKPWRFCGNTTKRPSRPWRTENPIEGETLYFATAPHKEVYRQLQANPNVELLAMAGNLSVRVTGSAVFDVPDDVAREIYTENPVLPRLYKAYSDLAYFRLPIEKLDYYDLTPTPPLFEHYERESDR